MILPVFRTSDVERSANLLSKNLRHVLVDCYSYAQPDIHFRADKIVPAMVYFGKVESQITRWQNNGGVLVRWIQRIVGPHEAIIYNSCPRSIELLDRYARETRILIVVRQPPTWAPLFDTIRERCQKKPHRLQPYNEAAERVKQMVESAPNLTPACLESLLLVHQGQIARPSFFPVLREGEARASGTAPIAP